MRESEIVKVVDIYDIIGIESPNLYFYYKHMKKFVLFYVDGEKHNEILRGNFLEEKKRFKWDDHVYSFVTKYTLSKEYSLTPVAYCNYNNQSLYIIVHELQFRVYISEFIGKVCNYSVNMTIMGTSVCCRNIRAMKFVGPDKIFRTEVKKLKKLIEKYEEKLQQVTQQLDDLMWSPQPGPKYLESLNGFNKALDEANSRQTS